MLSLLGMRLLILHVLLKQRSNLKPYGDPLITFLHVFFGLQIWSVVGVRLFHFAFFLTWMGAVCFCRCYLYKCWFDLPVLFEEGFKFKGVVCFCRCYHYKCWFMFNMVAESVSKPSGSKEFRRTQGLIGRVTTFPDIVKTHGFETPQLWGAGGQTQSPNPPTLGGWGPRYRETTGLWNIPNPPNLVGWRLRLWGFGGRTPIPQSLKLWGGAWVHLLFLRVLSFKFEALQAVFVFTVFF